MPKSATRTPSGTVRRGEAVGDLDAEAVVAEEDVADAGHEHAARHGAASAVERRSSGSTSSGWK